MHLSLKEIFVDYLYILVGDQIFNSGRPLTTRS